MGEPTQQYSLNKFKQLKRSQNNVVNPSRVTSLLLPMIGNSPWEQWTAKSFQERKATSFSSKRIAGRQGSRGLRQTTASSEDRHSDPLSPLLVLTLDSNTTSVRNIWTTRVSQGAATSLVSWRISPKTIQMGNGKQWVLEGTKGLDRLPL